MLKKILRFIYHKYDSGLYRIRKIFGIKIVTKPLINKINLLEEKIDKLLINDNRNNIFLSGYYLDYVNNYTNINGIYVSIIVIVYNLGEKYLKPCLESIINQSLKNIEIIVVNDNSPNLEDDKVCLEYSLKDSRIKYIKHEKNIGAGGARTTGLKAANGYSLFFVDGDDYLSLNACEIAFYHLIKYDVDVVTFGYFIVNELKIINNIFLEILPLLYGKTIIELFSLSKINPSLWNKLYKRDLLLKLGNDFMVTPYRAQDLNANYKIFTVTNSLINIPFHLYYYNIRDDSKDNTINEKYVTDIFFIFNDLIDFVKNKKFIEEHKKYINRVFVDNAILYLINKINNIAYDKERMKNIFFTNAVEFINLNVDFIDRDHVYEILRKNGLD